MLDWIFDIKKLFLKNIGMTIILGLCFFKKVSSLPSIEIHSEIFLDKV